jgi:phospholipid-binding lipoprotein MlaA
MDSPFRVWRRRLAALAVVVILSVGTALTAASASAEDLPADLDLALTRAAAHDHEIAANHGPSIDERRRNESRFLETAVLSIISRHPALTGPAISRAVQLSPSARNSLVERVSASFPGFADLARAASGRAPEPAGAHASSSAASPIDSAQPTPQSARVATSPALLLLDRPPDWPVLPREGGADGYTDIDPLEGMNRVFFYANGALDYLFFEPLARIYGYLMPDAAKHHLRQAFNNLGQPVVFANDLLQFEFHNAATTFSRFAINSSVGVAGLFDVATDLGLPAHTADFGQTLHTYGVGDGIYIVLPLFGSTTARDAVGIGVDSFIDPRGWAIDSGTRLALAVSEGVVRREALIDPVNFLVDNAEDPYDAVRAWTWQQRQRELKQECEEPVVTICAGFGG